MFIIHREENIIKLKPESVEDLWHLEKIIKPGDLVETLTERKREEESEVFREKMKLTIEVEKTEFHKDYGALKILGTIQEGPEDKISLGSHHSFKINQRDVLTIQKKEWKKHELKRLKEAKEESKQPKITIAIMDERTAQVFMIKSYGAEKKAEVQLPGKGKYADTSQKGKYYKQITDVLQEKETETDRYIVAGPGFEPDNYLDYLKQNNQKIHENSIRLKTNNIGEKGIYELMKQDKIDKVLRKSRLKDETRAINQLMTQISKEEKATYGYKEVEKAVEYGAIEKLLVTENKLFSEEDKLSELMEKTEQKNGEVKIISNENPESEKLESLGGIAAILRYKID